jgi:hypothetical protein
MGPDDFEPPPFDDDPAFDNDDPALDELLDELDRARDEVWPGSAEHRRCRDLVGKVGMGPYEYRLAEEQRTQTKLPPTYLEPDRVAPVQVLARFDHGPFSNTRAVEPVEPWWSRNDG